MLAWQRRMASCSIVTAVAHCCQFRTSTEGSGRSLWSSISRRPKALGKRFARAFRGCFFPSSRREWDGLPDWFSHWLLLETVPHRECQGQHLLWLIGLPYLWDQTNGLWSSPCFFFFCHFRTGSNGDVYDFAVVGGGIVGLATARQLLLSHPGKRVVVLEKENELGKGNESGADVHAIIDDGVIRATTRVCLCICVWCVYEIYVHQTSYDIQRYTCPLLDFYHRTFTIDNITSIELGSDDVKASVPHM